MNIFSVLDVRYEIFHSRMLHWLWPPDADHGGGDRFWQPMRELLGVERDEQFAIDEEMKINVAVAGRWRLADLLIRTGDLLVLVENKVDPAYQDASQVQNEIAGGRALAESEGATIHVRAHCAGTAVRGHAGADRRWRWHVRPLERSLESIGQRLPRRS
jgi:hypothetical protein